jgi:cell division protease FtsH
MGDVRERQRWVPMLVFLAVVVASLVWAAHAGVQTQPRDVPYSELLDLARSGRVVSLDLDDAALRAEIRSGDADGENERVRAVRLPGNDDHALLSALDEHHVPVRGVPPTPSALLLLVEWALPFVVTMAFLSFLARRAAARAGPLSVGKSRAKIYDRNADSRVTFGDVAGVDEAKAELTEIVRYLREPAAFRALGARCPKGVLLVGPPGTGKTLIARAVAGEANVPFFAISGSEFVQMFVGVGAARVRDLFEEAKSRAPCIVFIDELDAIGRARAGAVVGAMVHEEREQTLNQLLVEMDGFEGGTGVVILSATNRPEVLDPALLRAGRFDRQIAIDRPDLRGRVAILRVHAAKVKLGSEVDLEVVARRTPGMSGADLANVVNEAALAAMRRDGSAVESRDFEEAIDRIQLGLRKQGRVMTEAERRRVAAHEAGHALVALRVEHADPVHRVTIIPRSVGALGATLQLPTDDRHLLTRTELLDRLAVMLGGRAAEEVTSGDTSTGAENDLARATETARAMVMRYGMSERLGSASYAPDGVRFLGIEGAPRETSEETARVIDGEVHDLLESQHRRAVDILRREEETLQAIAARLLETETIDGAELRAIAGRAPARATTDRTLS